MVGSRLPAALLQGSVCRAAARRPGPRVFRAAPSSRNALRAARLSPSPGAVLPLSRPSKAALTSAPVGALALRSQRALLRPEEALPWAESSHTRVCGGKGTPAVPRAGDSSLRAGDSSPRAPPPRLVSNQPRTWLRSEGDRSRGWATAAPAHKGWLRPAELPLPRTISFKCF